jgi:PPOX class probable F420-dependent enzyme
VTTEALWRLIAEGRGGILATTNADGSPQLSNIYYICQGGLREIRFSTTTDRIKGRNLLRDHRAALHVSGANFLNYAVANGSVTLGIPRTPEDPVVDELFGIHQALGAEPARSDFGEQMVAANRMVVRLSATRLYGQLIDREPREIGEKNT